MSHTRQVVRYEALKQTNEVGRNANSQGRVPMKKLIGGKLVTNSSMKLFHFSFPHYYTIRGRGKIKKYYIVESS